MDLFVVPTISFDLLDTFVVVRLDRRDLVWINVIANPTAEWIACQLTEAFPWVDAPHHLIRDRDYIYGASSHADCAPWASATSLLHGSPPAITAKPLRRDDGTKEGSER
jgi:hypothetical protein